MLAQNNTNIEVAVTTIIVSFLMKKFSFDTIYYGMLYTVVFYCINNRENFDIKYYQFDFFINFNYLFYTFYSFFTLLLITMCYYIIKYKNKKDYLIVTLYDETKIKEFIKYVKKNQDYYEQLLDINYGDIDAKMELLINEPTDATRNVLEYMSNKTTQKLNQPIHFKDPYLNIEGYYEWKNVRKEQYIELSKTTKNINIKYIVLNLIKRKDLNVDDIFEKIEKFLTKYDNTICLYYTKIIYNGKENSNHRILFYSGEAKSIEVLEEIYMKPFFHQEKNRLYKTIKNVCTNPEYYVSRGQTARISLLLHGRGGTGKSTLIYRLAQCFKREIISLDLRNLSKYEAYQVIQRPLGQSYKKYIILFEEFDISIKELYIREEKANKIKNYDNLIEMVQSDKYASINIEKNKDVDLKLRDLLEIFQGPIPFEQMIIIATTNKYEEIKQMCSELFRPGRLTPVHFDYINKETLQELSMYYFNQTINHYIPDILPIPTSQIIELAFESLNMTNSFDYFVNHLNILIRNIKD